MQGAPDVVDHAKLKGAVRSVPHFCFLNLTMVGQGHYMAPIQKPLKVLEMTHVVLAELAASISELKKNPMGTALAGEGAPVAILNRNEPAFYCVPAKTFERMMERLDDLDLNRIADRRANDGKAPVRVPLDDL